jgi:hypothetical protein
MNKVFFFSILSFFFFSCSKKTDNNSQPSTGNINTISVVIDNQLWNGTIGDSIRNKFASPVEGLSKEEPQFNVNQYPIHVMEGFVTKSRTIIVVKIGNENCFEINKNEYASPQNVIHINGKTISDILDIIEKRTTQIIDTIQKGEIKAHRILINDSLFNTEMIQKQFKLQLKIPKNYLYVLKNENFVWLKNEFPSGNTSLLITQLPVGIIHPMDNLLEKTIKIHDSIGALYIKGNESGSGLYIDKSYPLYQSKILLDGMPAYETKGTWRLKGSFMFGAFVNYLIIDSKNNRIIFLEGFCYIPSKEQRNYMHELETIIKSAHLVSKNSN